MEASRREENFDKEARRIDQELQEKNILKVDAEVSYACCLPFLSVVLKHLSLNLVNLIEITSSNFKFNRLRRKRKTRMSVCGSSLNASSISSALSGKR